MTRQPVLGALNSAVTFALYAFVGATAACLFMAFSLVLLRLGAERTSLAATLAFVATMPFSYFGHRWITFRSNGRVAFEFPRFAVASAAGLGLTYAVTEVATSMNLSPTLALLLACVVVPVVNFWVLLAWVFVKARRASARRHAGNNHEG